MASLVKLIKLAKVPETDSLDFATDTDSLYFRI